MQITVKYIFKFVPKVPKQSKEGGEQLSVDGRDTTLSLKYLPSLEHLGRGFIHV